MQSQLRLVPQADDDDDPKQNYAFAQGSGDDPAALLHASQPTWYKGKRWASILEARTAYYFDYLHIPWEAEPLRFQTGVGTYTPDMNLPDHGCFIECKPAMPREDVLRKLALAASVSGRPILVVPGVPAPDLDCVLLRPGGRKEVGVRFCLCPWCGKDRVGFLSGGFLHCPHRQEAIAVNPEDAHHYIYAQNLLMAASEARAWLFLNEHWKRAA